LTAGLCRNNFSPDPIAEFRGVEPQRLEKENGAGKKRGEKMGEDA